MLVDTEFERNFAIEGYATDNNDNEQRFDDFANENTWQLFEDMEEKYDCAGFCYAPLFYLTRPISEGQPKSECLKPLFDDVLKSTQKLCFGMGGALALSLLL